MDQSFQKNRTGEGSIDFRNIIYLFWDHKFTLLFVATSLMLLAFTYSYFKIPEYESNTLIQVEKKTQNNMGAISQQFNLPRTENGSAVQTALIHSRFILEPVIEELALQVSPFKHNASFLERIFSSFRKESIIISKFDAPQTLKHLMMRVLDHNQYQILDHTNHVLVNGKVGEVSQSNDSKISIFVNQINARKGTLFDLKLSSKEAIIKNLLSDLKIEELNSGALGSQTGILQLSLRGTDPQRLTDILNTISRITLEKDANKKTLETAKTLEFLKKQLPLARKELDDAERTLTNYRIKSGKIDMRMETQQLLLLLSEIEKERTKVSMQKANSLQRFTKVHPFILGLDEKVKQLEIQKQKIAKKIRELPNYDQVSVSLMREIRVKNTIYLLLLNKIQELTVVKAGTLSDVRILAPAVIPEVPLSKKTSLVSIAGFVLGLILASLYVVGRKAFRCTVNDPQWVETNLNLTNLAIIPYSKKQSIINIFKRSSEMKKLEILAEKYPRDLSIEALRSLRTSFQIMLTEAENNIVSIMGVSQGIGKSFVSLNFSYLLANIGKRILLIDGDIRKGHLNDYFDTKQQPGLTELIKSDASEEEVIHKVNNNFHFISSGKYPANPSEVLNMAEFKKIMHHFSQQYDLVIIDTAPILAVTDCILIGKLSSTNLLVLGSNRHEPEEIVLAIKQLHHAGIKILGTIFNTLQPNTVVYGNYRHKYSAYFDDNQEAVA